MVFAAGVIAIGIAQYPGGWLADRYGRRPVLIAAEAISALLFLGYLLPLPPAFLLAVRFLQSFAVGAYRPAAAALIADLVGPRDRARGFGLLRAADMFGLLVGPVLGGLAAELRLDLVFYVAFLLSSAATLVLLWLPSTRPAAPLELEPPQHPLRMLWMLAPVLVLAVPIQWVIGNYDTIWSLYLNSRGATKLQIGLSFAVFALPVLALSSATGALADRIGHRLAALTSVLTYAVMNAVYPLLGNVWALVWLGAVEGALTAWAQPALSAEVSRSAPPERQGRVQGVYGAVLMAGQAVGALAGGALLGFGALYSFLAASAVCVLCAAASLWFPARARITEA